MSANSPIEWTDHTFNIAWGCMKVSPGCQHCYADTLAHRRGHDVWGPASTTSRRTFGAKHWAEPLKWNRDAEKEGVRKRVFCSSMCDVCEDHPTVIAELQKLWPLIRATPWLDWQLLTKRPENIVSRLPDDWGDGYANVWWGTSIESQDYASRAWILIRDVKAVVLFLSMEPLLAGVELSEVEVNEDTTVNVLPAIDWVIVGGESGAKARAMELEWALYLRDQCSAYGIPFFLKQLGGFPDKRGHERALLDGRRYTEMPVGAATGDRK